MTRTAANSAHPRPSVARPEPMPRVSITRKPAGQKTLEVEIARLRDLDAKELQAPWQTVFRRRPPPHLPRHLLFRVLAYRVQADQLGDLNSNCQRLLDRSGSPGAAGQRAVDFGWHSVELRTGTVLGREWNGRMHRVAVTADGFAWNGKTYPSLSKVALGVTRLCDLPPEWDRQLKVLGLIPNYSPHSNQSLREPVSVSRKRSFRSQRHMRQNSRAASDS